MPIFTAVEGVTVNEQAPEPAAIPHHTYILAVLEVIFAGEVAFQLEGQPVPDPDNVSVAVAEFMSLATIKIFPAAGLFGIA